MEASNARRGVMLMLLGTTLFSFNDALGKLMVSDFAVGQILAVRSLAALVVLAPLILRAGVRETFFVEEPGRHLVRVVLVAIEVAMFYWAVRYLPLAETMTIYQACPLFVTALSVPLLGERATRRQWLAVAIGFAGVLLVMRPGSAIFSWPSLVALGGTLAFALMLISTRTLRTSGAMTLITWQTIGVAALGLVTLPFGWPPLDFKGFLLLALIGVVATLAHMCVNKALSLAPAALVVPFNYTLLLWAVFFGYVIWQDVPTPLMVLGGCLIVASGFYIFRTSQAKTE